MDENWMVTHEHNSVPFDAETGKASLDLKPEFEGPSEPGRYVPNK
jgi:hypothetical protein